MQIGRAARGRGGLSFDFTLGLLNLFVLDHIHYLDQIRYGVIVQDILAALNAFLQKGGCKMGLTVGLSREKGSWCRLNESAKIPTPAHT